MTATIHELRKACAKCGRTVGMLPNGRALPYRTERRPDGEQIHYCADDVKCRLARLLAQSS